MKLHYFESLAEPQQWVCTNCADFIGAGELCPKCGANRVVSLAERDFQELISAVLTMAETLVFYGDAQFHSYRAEDWMFAHSLIKADSGVKARECLTSLNLKIKP